MNTNKTYQPKPEGIIRGWHLIDADNKVLGRLATQVATLLMGKHKADFISSIDCGDFVVVTNAGKIVLTGKKREQKLDYRHSGYPRGDKYTPYGKLMDENPEKAVMLAVKGMLPKNKLRDRRIKRLKIYRESAHPHAAQFSVKKEKEAAAQTESK